MTSLNRVVIILLCYCSQNAFAGDIKFRLLDINKSLPQNTVFSIIQDKIGFLWFGTNNNRTYKYSSLYSLALKKNKYPYKLENNNKKWICQDGSRQFTFSNLFEGRYIVRVKASNNSVSWNEEGTSNNSLVKSSWWRTWWAYSVYTIFLISLIIVFRYYELNRIRLKDQLKLEKLETDTLRNLDQIKSVFFANISHEFRTPLTLILGHIESIKSSEIPVKTKEKLEIAYKNASKLLSLINELLDLSKLEAGGMELTTKQLNLVSFLKNILYSFESLAISKNISLNFECQEENIPVTFDPDKMEKVFYNLVSNALKFTGQNGRIKISVNCKDNSLVVIRVEDTGIGIPADQVSRIFDRFFQVDSSSSREYGGTGIGLALAKELIEIHKGKIKVNSTEGKGTEFIVEIQADENRQVITAPEILSYPEINPITNENQITEEIINMDPSPHADIVNSNGKIVLIVEDNSDVRNYIREYLENDYRIIEGNNGQEGLDIAREEIPDLIITDVMMPKMDGFQFAREIRDNEKTSHIPIIMLTAKAGVEDKIEGLETGIDDYLTKPFNEKELKVRMKNLILSREQLRKRFTTSTTIKPSEVTAVSVDQAFLEKTLEIIETHFEDEYFSVDSLAEKVNMSVSQINRKLNALINQPAGQLIRSLKLQRAADLLKQNAGTISEICYKLGFSDQAYFSRAFKKHFGYSPREFKELSKQEKEN